MTQALLEGKIKAAFILGEDPVEAGLVEAGDLAKLEFLMAASPYLTATAALADVVLPMSTSLEVDGTYITADGRMVAIRAAKDSPAGQNNLDIWAALSQRMNPNWDIDFVYPPERQSFLHTSGFAARDGKAVLAAGADGPIFVPVKITDPTLLKFRG